MVANLSKLWWPELDSCISALNPVAPTHVSRSLQSSTGDKLSPCVKLNSTKPDSPHNGEMNLMRQPLLVSKPDDP